MKYTIFSTALLVAIIFSGCKSKITETKIKPKTVTVKGDYGPYFEVIDKEYVVKKKSDDGPYQIVVEVKRTDIAYASSHDPRYYNIHAMNYYDFENKVDFFVGFGIEFLGDSGPIKTLHPENENEIYHAKDDMESLIGLKPGELGYLHFNYDEEDITSLKSFQITSAIQKNLKRKY